MLAGRRKDWTTVCKLASGPHYMHMHSCVAGLVSGQARRVVWERAGPDQMPNRIAADQLSSRGVSTVSSVKLSTVEDS